jgi:hypothetical protein
MTYLRKIQKLQAERCVREGEREEGGGGEVVVVVVVVLNGSACGKESKESRLPFVRLWPLLFFFAWR